MCDRGAGFTRRGDIGGISGRYASSGGNDTASVGDLAKIAGEILVETTEDRGNKHSILEGGASSSNYAETVWSSRCAKDEYGGTTKFVGASSLNPVAHQ